MENNSRNVAEIDKYAFLLGSAIKNEDTDQFFSIYDTILPKDIPDNQLEEIKDKARQVSELPDRQFNSLVLEARTFSLAPTGITMSDRGAGSKWSTRGNISEEDDHVTPLDLSKITSRSDTSSVYSSTKMGSLSESETRRFDDDSGVCISSKATNSVGSLSDDDSDDEEGRVFDYYPPQVKIRHGCGMNLDYDEAHSVKSDHESSQDVNSPRSDISDGIELTTFASRRRHEDTDDDEQFTRDRVNYQDDFHTTEESEDDDVPGYHKLTYRSSHHDSLPTFKPKFASQNKINLSSLRSTEPDERIRFGLSDRASQYSRHGRDCYPKSEKVKIEKNSYKKDPPFGKGLEQLNKVGSSINQLISSDIPSDKVKNMPEGRKLEVLQPKDTSRKKKKKKSSKDDGTDENGNPLEASRLLQHKQMREPPPSPDRSTVANSQNHNTISYSSDYGSTKSTLQSSNVEDRKKHRKKQKEVVIKSEEVENYKGNQPIDDIISFIGGQDAAKKKTKKLTATPNTEDIPSKTQKSNKKNKDKKQKPLTGSVSVDDGAEVKGGNSAQSLASDLDGSDNMGNSSAKPTSSVVVDTSVVENGDIDTSLCMKKEKLDLLKDKEKTPKKDKQSSVEYDDHVISINYKDKDKNHTNDKHVAISATNVVSDNNKKKSEKPIKAPNVEKTEMPESKSEVKIKVDTSVANSITVKQKNAKNKKSKPGSPTLQAESDVFVGDNIDSPGFPDLPNTDTNFIFTDLDVPHVPKEDEFTVVSKKKKKIQNSGGHTQNNHVSSGNSGGSSNKRKHEDKRGGASNVSHSFSKVTSAQAPVQQAIPVESDTHIRDLSPSAFPALGSNKGREGRRNSTGDVPIPSGLKTQDDSDLESVKSLPATQGSLRTDPVLSPRLSYARMAAVSNKPVEAGDSLVWKGSFTERRHSIGSSPEVVNKNTGSNIPTAAASLKAGSQEHIVIDQALKAPDHSGANSRTTDAWGKHTDNTASNTDIVLTKDTSSPSDTILVEATVLAAAPLPIHSVPVITDSESVSQSQLISASKPTITNKPVECAHIDNSEAKNSSSSLSSKNHSVSHSSVHKHESIKPSKSTNGSNGKKHKSVIFLDKRVEEAPGNLGISFGFEMDTLDKAETAAVDSNTATFQIDHTANTNIDNPVHSAHTSFVCESYLEPKDLVNIDKSIPSHKSSSASVISNNINPSKDNVIADSNNSDKKAQVVKMNGIVPHNTQDQSVNLNKQLDLVKDPVGNVSEHVTLDFMNYQEASESLIVKDKFAGKIVYYGQYVEGSCKEITIPSETNGPIQYCGRIGYVEPEEYKNNFNIIDAVQFLSREWNRTEKLREKEGGKVHIFSA